MPCFFLLPQNANVFRLLWLLDFEILLKKETNHVSKRPVGASLETKYISDEKRLFTTFLYVKQAFYIN